MRAKGKKVALIYRPRVVCFHIGILHSTNFLHFVIIAKERLWKYGVHFKQKRNAALFFYKLTSFDA